MQLVEDRKVDLETDIRTYLPDSFLEKICDSLSRLLYST